MKRLIVVFPAVLACNTGEVAGPERVAFPSVSSGESEREPVDSMPDRPVQTPPDVPEPGLPPVPPAAPPPPDGEIGTVPLSFRGRMMGRSYVLAILRDAFEPRDTTGRDLDRFRAAIRSLEDAPSTMGRACNPYSSHTTADCEDAILVAARAELQPPSSIVRQLQKMAVCEEILHRAAPIRTAATLSNGYTNGDFDPPNRASISEAFQLFFRGRSATDAELAALEAFVSRLSRDGLPLLEQWRGLLQVVCEHPGWESV
ncbi:MAG: hypothetical protein AAF654_00365 [Myxococcota bacterium]